MLRVLGAISGRVGRRGSFEAIMVEKETGEWKAGRPEWDRYVCWRPEAERAATLTDKIAIRGG